MVNLMLPLLRIVVILALDPFWTKCKFCMSKFIYSLLLTLVLQFLCLIFSQFANVLGAIYRKGDILFTPDGNSIISPVGNRICIYNLKKYVDLVSYDNISNAVIIFIHFSLCSHTSTALPLESRFNYECLALSPSGNLLIAVNEGELSAWFSIFFFSLLRNFVIKLYQLYVVQNSIEETLSTMTY